MVALVVLISAPPATALAAATAALTAASRILRRTRRRRTADESRALAGALQVLVGELRSGAHPVHAFEAAADEASGVVRTAFSGVAARARLGGEVVTGLRAVASRSAVGAEWDRLAVCWQIATDHGLPISALVRTAHNDIVERQRFSERVESNMAGARATAAILAALPVLGVVLGELIGAAPVAFLFGEGVGGGLLVAGTVLLCCGVGWAGHITDRVQA